MEGEEEEVSRRSGKRMEKYICGRDVKEMKG